MFFSQSASNTPLNGLTITGLNISNSLGAVGQVGFDYMLDRYWGLNFDVKKLFLEPNYTATVNNAIPVSGRANINPLADRGRHHLQILMPGTKGAIG